VKRLQIEVPATSANLGPGFDTLGLALDIVDTVSVELSAEGDEVRLCEVCGEDGHNTDPEENLLCRAYRSWAGDREPRGRIVRLAGALEGHADNTTAAALGGMTTAFRDGDDVHALHLANHLNLGVSLFLPEQRLPTAEARSLLPRSIPLRDAVFDLGRLAYLTTALIWGRWECIGPAMEDRLHQPFRARLIPALPDVIAAAREAGAYGAALSGGGPAVIALGPPEQAERVAAAMEARARELDWLGRGIVTRVRELGVQVKTLDAAGAASGTG
jgi:homoserine kinase